MTPLSRACVKWKKFEDMFSHLTEYRCVTDRRTDGQTVKYLAIARPYWLFLFIIVLLYYVYDFIVIITDCARRRAVIILYIIVKL